MAVTLLCKVCGVEPTGKAHHRANCTHTKEGVATLVDERHCKEFNRVTSRRPVKYARSDDGTLIPTGSKAVVGAAMGGSPLTDRKKAPKSAPVQLVIEA